MTDEQIEKALECCSDLECTSCTECPLFTVGKECPIVLHSNALALIKRQREEIAKVRAEAIREFETRALEIARLRYLSGFDIFKIVKEMTEEQQ